MFVTCHHEIVETQFIVTPLKSHHQPLSTASYNSIIFVKNDLNWLHDNTFIHRITSVTVLEYSSSESALPQRSEDAD